MGMAYDQPLGYLYSCSEDGKVKVTDTTTMTQIYECAIGKGGLKAMEFDEQNKRFILADGEGRLIIYSTEKSPPVPQITVQAANKSCIRGMCTDHLQNYIFTGSADGDISVFEYGKPGKERFTK
jgi:WD40 repeat protein